MHLNEITSGQKHSLETLRAAWKRTQSGQTADNVVTDKEHEVEYYLTNALFSAQMRLGELRTRLCSASPDVPGTFGAELSAIEDDLRVCAESLTLLLQNR